MLNPSRLLNQGASLSVSLKTPFSSIDLALFLLFLSLQGHCRCWTSSTVFRYCLLAAAAPLIGCEYHTTLIYPGDSVEEKDRCICDDQNVQQQKNILTIKAGP